MGQLPGVRYNPRSGFWLPAILIRRIPPSRERRHKPAMYIAELFNSQGIFQSLGGWSAGVTPAGKQKIESILFRATTAYIALHRMRLLGNACVEQFRRQRHELTIKSERIVFWSPTLVEYVTEISPFLSSVRTMQNLILPLVANTVNLGKTVPSSLADAIKTLNKLGFSDEIRKIVRSYWAEGGCELKGYRDLDQHYETLVRQSFIELAPEERIIVHLPDDPMQRNLSRATYNKKRDALDYCAESFSKLDQLLDSLASSLGIDRAPLQLSVGLGELGKLQEGEKKTLGLIVEDVRTAKGIEIGQTPELRVYMREVPPQATDATHQSAK